MLLSMTFKAVSEKPSTSTEIRRRLRKIKFYLLFRSACTNFSPCFASTEIRRRLRKIKFYLLFRSACTNFVAESLNKRVARRVM